MNKDNITPSEFRKLCKTQAHSGHTSGFCTGFAQANVLILPRHAADDFELLCERNPVPCPLLGKTLLNIPTKIDNSIILNDSTFDLRYNLPKYRIFENGEFLYDKTDVFNEWEIDNHVGFLIGCSFSFEKALENEGLIPRNVALGKNVSMFTTNKYLDNAGIFINTPYVVSMRPYKLNEIEKVRNITRKFKKTHGEPIDWGFDAVKRLGIKDLNNPEFGDSCDILEDEVPVFWACGVTTQVAASVVGKSIKGKVMSHSPGCMLVLDIKDSEVSLL